MPKKPQFGCCEMVELGEGAGELGEPRCLYHRSGDVEECLRTALPQPRSRATSSPIPCARCPTSR